VRQRGATDNGPSVRSEYFFTVGLVLYGLDVLYHLPLSLLIVVVMHIITSKTDLDGNSEWKLSVQFTALQLARQGAIIPRYEQFPVSPFLFSLFFPFSPMRKLYWWAVNIFKYEQFSHLNIFIIEQILNLTIYKF
jgi:hypothetical protein